MSGGSAAQGVGLVMVLAALSWLLGPWFLLVAGAVFLIVPEIVARGRR